MKAAMAMVLALAILAGCSESKTTVSTTGPNSPVAIGGSGLSGSGGSAAIPDNSTDNSQSQECCPAEDDCFTNPPAGFLDGRPMATPECSCESRQQGRC